MVTSKLGLVGVLVLGVLVGCTAEQPQASGTAEVARSVAEPTPAADRAVPAGDRAAAAQPVPVSRQVVRTAVVDLQVDDLGAATGQARRVATAYGGYVAAEQSGPQRSSLTLRVAADRLDDALAELAELGEVNSRELRVEDVTEQAVDLEARLESQRASVQRVRGLLDRAVTIGEVVQVEAELTWRQAELESLEQRAAALADQVALCTVNVDLAGPGSAPADGFVPGLSTGWDALRAAATAVLTVLGAVLPFVVVLGLPAAGVALWWRHRRRAAPAES